MNENELRQKLTREQYRIMRQKGTEAPFSGKLLNNKAEGAYMCAACGQELFKSDTKFDSGSGWPSFTDPANHEHVKLELDTSHGMQRVEVQCATCGSHLGHVFDDGPSENGKRYCINSACLNFEPKK